MKPYPTDTFEVLGDDLTTVIGTIIVPSKEAQSFNNFENYLEKDELAFYRNLQQVEQLQLALSSDPFRALLMLMGKI